MDGMGWMGCDISGCMVSLLIVGGWEWRCDCASDTYG